MDKVNMGKKLRAYKFARLLHVKRNAQKTPNARHSISQKIIKGIVVVCTRQQLKETRLERTKENIAKERRVR